MSFEEDFSSQYLPVLALRLKCSPQSKYLCGKPFGCSQQHLLMNACYCRSLRYTKYRLPFSKIQRYAESKLPKPSVIMCSWQTLRSVYSTGCFSSGSVALREHQERVWRQPRSSEGPALLQGSPGRLGLAQAQLPPHPAPGGQNLYLTQSESNLKRTDRRLTRIPSSPSFCCAALLVFQLGICMFSYISYSGCIFQDPGSVILL